MTAVLDSAVPKGSAAGPGGQAAAGLPLTSAQSGMWFAQALDPDSPAQNTAEYIEIHGPLDPAVFAEALHRTAGEADALRVRIIAGAAGSEGPRQVPIEIEPPGRPAPTGTSHPGRPGHPGHIDEQSNGPVRCAFPLHQADLRGPESRADGVWRAGSVGREGHHGTQGHSSRQEHRSRQGHTGRQFSDGQHGPDAVALAWMRADLATPFDLAAGPLFQHALFRVGDERWLWYQRVHHLVMDGYGYSLLARRVAEVYTALAADTEPGPSPFGRLTELVAADHAYRSDEAYHKDRAYWAAEIGVDLGHFGANTGQEDTGQEGAGQGDAAGGGGPRAVDVPGAPNLAGRTALPDRTFVRHTAHLGHQETERLRTLAASLRATWPDLLFATQALYLSRATHSENVVLGLPMMGRMGSTALRIPGMVMNVLPLRLRVSPQDTLADLVRQVVLGIRAARRHQRYRYEDMRRDLGLLGDGRALVGPLINVMPFDYGLTFAGARSQAHNLATGPVDDLTVNIYDRADGAGLRIDYDGNPQLYTEPELATHQRRFLDLLARVADPGTEPHAPLGDLAVLTAAERTQVLAEFNDTARSLPPTTLIGPIESRAARVPDATALVFGATALTYAQLNTRAGQLARRLIELGVRPGVLAAVALPRSVDLVVALLAVLKAGGAYLPLDPDYPAERLAYMLDDAKPVCVLTNEATSGALPATELPILVLDDPQLRAELATKPGTDPGRALTPHHPAYVIYTSGSTGRPKGVVVPHSAIDNRLRWMQDTYRLTPDDRVLQKTPSGFDVSVWEFFWALREGATLVVAEPGGHQDPAYLARIIREQGITTTHFVPSLLGVFLTEPGAVHCTGLRRVFCSGEALPRETVTEFHRLLPGVPLHNLYGPTEAAVDVTYHPCEAGESGPVPIGKPVWNTRLYVLDAALQPCPPGIAGELYLAGAQLASGYLGRPELTATRFVADPFAAAQGEAGARMYRTGDLARWRTDGCVEYLGRTDHQVKLRGLRIELGEIEAALAAQDGVAAACALVREDRPGDQRLIGYVTGHQPTPQTGWSAQADAAARADRSPTERDETRQAVAVAAAAAEADRAGEPGPRAAGTAPNGTDALPAGTAVVEELDPTMLKERLAARLPDYMVPSAIVVLDAFPLSPNGKLERKALPAPPATATAVGRAPRSHQEESLTRLFAQVLGVEQASVDDSFFELGGNSLLAVRLVAAIRETLGTELALGTLFQAPTPAALAERVLAAGDGEAGRGANGGADDALGVLLPLRAGGRERPLFALHPAGGISWCYAGLLSRLGSDQPLYGLQARGLTEPEPLPGTMEEQAADYLDHIRSVQPHGPYRLLGWSVGGVIAHTVAVRLQEAGERVELLALMDAYPSDQWRTMAIPAQADAERALLRMAGFDIQAGESLTRAQVIDTLRREGSALASLPDYTLTAVVDIVVNNAMLMRKHEHRTFEGDVLFFTATAPRAEDWLTREAWQPYVTGRLVNHDIDCLHPQLTQPGPLARVAEAVREWLRDAI
ncbi:non-ribosomal peptide synthetase [Streptomyces zagrosensis]|uniref:Enterobactin synthetase component F n=1 Tax=Streptomyces zagrosensis TaxID=1042984 RepID=A0A7W9QC39_9ACTN|nr:non-ribosomal peptide synthetase [Streptomyces zagrosensis]MBB5937401.1 enterobactin synthetase component F [Streptomyces zagrosensis]